MVVTETAFSFFVLCLHLIFPVSMKTKCSHPVYASCHVFLLCLFFNFSLFGISGSFFLEVWDAKETHHRVAEVKI